MRARFFLGPNANHLGDAAKALAHTEAAVGPARGGGDDVDRHAYTLIQLGDEIHRRGDIQRAAELHEEAMRLAGTIGDRYAEMLAAGSLSWDVQALGDPTRAEHLYSQSIDLGRAIDTQWGVAMGLTGLAAIAASGRDAERAIRLLAAAEALTAPIGFDLASELLKFHDDALKTARAQLGAARVTAIWDAVRASPVDQAVAEALAPSRSTPGGVTAGTAAPVSEDFGLSSREREIVALLAQRLTDKEIADTLFISARTVMTHATNIFNKLGVANRRDAAAVAAKHGLV
jgi:non-specific serine/threonine protein kinase